MFGRLDLLKWFGDREKSFSKYTHDFLKLSGSKKTSSSKAYSK